MRVVARTFVASVFTLAACSGRVSTEDSRAPVHDGGGADAADAIAEPTPIDTRTLHAVHAVAPDEAWAVGPGFFENFGAEDAGVILHWDGVSWSWVDDLAAPKLYAVWGPSKQETWAVGLGATILHRRAK